MSKFDFKVSTSVSAAYQSARVRVCSLPTMHSRLEDPMGCMSTQARTQASSHARTHASKHVRAHIHVHSMECFANSWCWERLYSA